MKALSLVPIELTMIGVIVSKEIRKTDRLVPENQNWQKTCNFFAAAMKYDNGVLRMSLLMVLMISQEDL